MSAARIWDEAMLQEMRQRGDPPADRLVQELVASHDIASASRVFGAFGANDAQLPQDAPARLRAFVAATGELPTGLDVARAEEGARVLLDNAFLCAFILLAKTLPEGYAAPPLSRILHFTHNLEYHPYRRLLGVLQLLVNISAPGAFVPQGRAVVTAQKLRLLHAGIRHVVREKDPDFAKVYGSAVSQEDLIYTTLTFSHHVIEGLKALGAPLTADQADAYYAMWHGYGLLQGVDPRWMPANLEEAESFSAVYARHFVAAEANPAGVALTQADLNMLQDLVPGPLRALGLGLAPRFYMVHLIGDAAAARVGLQRATGHHLLGWMLMRLPALWRGFWGSVAPHREQHEALSRLFFRDLIKRTWNGEVTFSIPESMRDLGSLA